MLNCWIVRLSSYRLRRRSRPAGFTKAAALICIYMEYIRSKRFRLATNGLKRLVTPTFAKKRHGHHRPEDYRSKGAPFVQIFTFNKGRNTGLASFVGKDTGKKAQIPIAPFMGVYGVAPLRKGMYRTVPPNVSGGMGGNTDIKQFTKGSKLYYPVYVKGAKFSVGDGHMAQGDGEICVTAIETLMGVTCRFKVIKNTIIESPQAIVPLANPTDFGLTPEMRAKGFYHTTGVGPDLMSDAKQAVRAMVRDQGLSLHEAYAICSVAGDLKISEIVDVPNWVVSMTVPRGIFES